MLLLVLLLPVRLTVARWVTYSPRWRMLRSIGLVWLLVVLWWPGSGSPAVVWFDAGPRRRASVVNLVRRHVCILSSHKTPIRRLTLIIFILVLRVCGMVGELPLHSDLIKSLMWVIWNHLVTLQHLVGPNPISLRMCVPSSRYHTFLSCLAKCRRIQLANMWPMKILLAWIVTIRLRLFLRLFHSHFDLISDGLVLHWLAITALRCYQMWPLEFELVRSGGSSDDRASCPRTFFTPTQTIWIRPRSQRRHPVWPHLRDSSRCLWLWNVLRTHCLKFRRKWCCWQAHAPIILLIAESVGVDARAKVTGLEGLTKLAVLQLTWKVLRCARQRVHILCVTLRIHWLFLRIVIE